MTSNMYAMLKEVPVWPKSVKITRLCIKHGVFEQNLPTDCTVGIDEGNASWFSQKIKDRYLDSVKVDG